MLGRVSCSAPAHVRDPLRVTQGFEQAPVTLQKCDVPAHEQPQGPGGSGRDPAADRCLEHADSPFPGGVGQDTANGRRGAGHVYPGGRRRQGCQRAAGHQHHVSQFWAARKHGDQDIRGSRHRGARAAPARAARYDSTFQVSSHITGRYIETGPDEVGAHGQAHPARADKTYAHPAALHEKSAAGTTVRLLPQLAAASGG